VNLKSPDKKSVDDWEERQWKAVSQWAVGRRKALRQWAAHHRKLLNEHRQSLSQWAEHHRKGLERLALWAAGLLVFALLMVALIPSTASPADRSLYETAALTIPLLILALAVDNAWHSEWNFGLLLLVLVFLVAGEFASMIGTAYDVQKGPYKDFLIDGSRPLTDLLEFFAVAGLGVGLIAVLWGLVFRAPSKLTRRKPPNSSDPAAPASG
jgi:hypothetical protein